MRVRFYFRSIDTTYYSEDNSAFGVSIDHIYFEGLGLLAQDFTPYPQSYAVDEASPIRVDFSDPANTATINASSFSVTGSVSGTIDGSFSFSPDGLAFVFTPTTPFAEDEIITCLLSDDVLDLNGLALDGDGDLMPGGDRVWQFSTFDIPFSAIPTTPTGMAAAVDGGEVNLTWNANPAEELITEYRIYRAEPSEDFALLDSIDATMPEYVDATGVTGTRYLYQVTALNSFSSESVPSSEVCATPGDSDSPAAPMTPTAVTGDRSIELIWATPQDEVECDIVAYVVHRTADGEAIAVSDTIPALPLEQMSHTGSVVNYLEYCYTVQALDNAGLLSLHSAELCTLATGPSADLRLVKLVDVSMPDIDAQVTFSLELTNDGPDATTNAVVTDLLPDGLTFVSATSGDYGALTGEWLVGALGADQTATLDIVATVDVAGDTLWNTASVVDDGTTDLDTTNNADTAWILGRACDLELVKTVDDDDPSVGDEIFFKVVVTNHGPDTATGVEVIDELQPGLTYLRAEKSSGTYIGDLWRLGTMPVGQVDSLMIFARVDEPGSVCNSAAATAAGPPDLDSENDSDQACMAGRSADLVLTKTATPIGPEVGDLVTFRLTIRNDGPSSVDDVVVIDALPDGLIDINVPDVAGTTYVGDTWTIDHLAVDESLVLTVSATMNTEDPLTNSAHIESSSLSDPDPNNNVAFVTLSTEQVDLWLSKVVDEPSVSVGDTVTFTVVLTNDDLVPATNIRVLDSAAPGLTFVSYETTNGGYDVGSGIWSVGTLAAETADSLTVRATVDQAITVGNTATLIGADQADPDQANNSDSVEVTGMAADLAIIVTVSGSYNPRPAVGEIVTLNMLVRNVGPSVAEMVRIHAPLPEDDYGDPMLGLQSTVPNDGSYDYLSGYWDIGTLAAGASKNMALTVEVLAAEPMRFICAIDRSSVPDTWDDNDISEINFYIVDADLALDKAVSDPAPPINSNVTYTLTVTNNGPDDVTDVEVTDALPAGVTFVSAAASTGAYAGDVWTVGDLADGVSETLAITVTADELAEITNQAEITGSTGRDDNLADNTDFVDMQPVDPVPTVTVGSYDIAVGDPVTVSAVIIDNVSVADASLHYRAGNVGAFTTAPMTTAAAADTWQADIPAGVADEFGLVCYVSAHDDAGGEGVSDMVGVSVTVADVVSPRAQPGGSATSSYRMISVPLELDDPRAAVVMEDDLGTYNIENWRMFGLNASGSWENSEFPNCGPMEAGSAFFLIVKEAGKVIDTGAGSTVPMDEPFAVNLHAGWNLVGNPFNFNVPMANIDIESSAALDIRNYEGSWGVLTGSSNLEPFHGYLVKAMADNDRLLIDPTGSVVKRAPVETPAPAWSLDVAAAVSGALDDDNVAAVYDDAVDGYDAFDLPEPPSIGGYVSMSFPHRDWEGAFTQFCKDARPAEAAGWSWDMEVRTNVAGRVTIDWAGLESVPEELQVWLRDEILMINVDLREVENYAFVGAHQTETPRQLRLVIGDEDYIAAELPESESIPTVLTLKSNFPNPFNPATTIRYGVPSESRVELGVYDMRGRLVRRLVNEVKPAGYHVAVWEGTDDSGQRVASGVYLYRVVADGEAKNQKMLLVK